MEQETDSILRRKSLMREVANVMDYGKLPPQAQDLEEAVLGAVMIEEGVIHDIIEIVHSPEIFYNDKHKLIWKAIKQIYYTHTKIDLLTVTEQLKKNGDLESAGGPFYIAQLTNKVASAANSDVHARIVTEKFIARELIKISTNTTKDAYDDTADVFELLNTAALEIENINLQLTSEGQQSYIDMVAEEVEKLRNAANTGDYITGITTGSNKLDKQLLGFQPGNLIIIAGRPSMGKTSVALHFATQQLKQGIPVGFFSLEMGKEEIIQKQLSAEISVDSQTLRKGGLKKEEWNRLDDRMKYILSFPFQLNDTAGLSIAKIRAISRNWVRKHGVKIIYIDYLQLIQGEGEKKFSNREAEISHISRLLKRMAKELKIPVVALSQLSRSVETRGGDKRPMLSDLRESGAIEQDADVVMFCYRPEYYHIPNDDEGNPYPANYMELILAKYRNGGTGTIRQIFEKEYSRLYDYEIDTHGW
jgi:replicative DNA helicase